MPVCFVTGCRSGYRRKKDESNLEKRHFFKVKEENVELWSRRIPRMDKPLTINCHVCDLHFDERYILKTFTHMINGERVEIERGKWDLTKDAIPTIFPNLPKYLTVNLPKKRASPKKRHSISCTQKRKSARKDDSHALSALLLPSSNETSILPPLNIEIPSSHESGGSDKCLNSISSGSFIQMKETLQNTEKRLQNLQKENQQLKKDNKVLKSKLEFLEQELKNYKLKNETLPSRQQMLIKHSFRFAQLSTDECRKNGMRYDEDWMMECILLRIRSPTCYEFLRNNDFMPLPDRRTINRYIGNMQASFGFNPELFTLLKEKVNDMPENEKKGILMWDEMSLQKHIELNKHTGYVTGFTDFGGQISCHRQDIGDHALVFLFQPYLNGWSQTIGTFCAKGATPGHIVAHLLLKAIICLENCGLHVTSTVCDGSSSNKLALSLLGVNGNIDGLKHTFMNPVTEDDIFVMFDVPHGIKCIRNNLVKAGKFKLPYGDVKMEHYCALLAEEEKHITGLRVVPKLKQAHVMPNSFQKMTVSLATQLFSESVANGLAFYKSVGVMQLSDSDATITVTRFLNRLFDALNRKLPKNGVKKSSEDLKVIADAIEFIDNWEKFIQQSTEQEKKFFLTPQTCSNWRITLHSVYQLVNSLLDEGFLYVLTNHFTQDPLERFFGMIRQGCGGDTHPTTVQFMYLYRLMSVYSLVKPPKRAAVEYCPVDILLQLKHTTDANRSTLLKKLDQQVEQYLPSSPVSYLPNCPLEPLGILDDHNYATIEYKQCIIYYLGGFVARKLISNKCEECRKTMISEKPSHALVAKMVTMKSKGGLIYPSQRLYLLLNFVEDCIEKHLAANLNSDVYFQIIAEFLSALQASDSYHIGCTSVDHRIHLTSQIVHFYVTCRLHFFIRQKNKILKSKIKTKSNRKIAHLQ